MPGPFDGIRIIDATMMVSGPMATMMLADQGAEVIHRWFRAKTLNLLGKLNGEEENAFG